MKRIKTKIANDSKIADQDGERVNTADEDSDTLQILDELDREWVRHWRKATSKETAQAIRLTIIVPSQEKARYQATPIEDRT